MSRQFIFCKDATSFCWQLCVDEDNNDEDAEFLTLENGEDNEEIGDDDKEVAVNHEEDIEDLEEGDNNDADDDDASSDEDVNSE